MPSKLEQVVALLDSMSKLELESVNAVTQANIERLPDTTKCHLLNLPAELRNIIYHYVAIIHLRTYGNTQRCGLLGVNKQIRIEFMDIMYSGEVATLKSGTGYHVKANSRRLRIALEPADRKSLKTLLDGLEGVTKIQGAEFLKRHEARDKMQRDYSQSLSDHDRDMDVLRVLGVLVLNSEKTGHYLPFSCWIHEAKQYGLTYEIPEGYPAHLLPGFVSEDVPV